MRLAAVLLLSMLHNAYVAGNIFQKPGLFADGGADVQQQPHWLVASRQWASDNYYEFVEVSNVGTNGDALRGPDGGESLLGCHQADTQAVQLDVLLSLYVAGSQTSKASLASWKLSRRTSGQGCTARNRLRLVGPCTPPTPSSPMAS